MISEHIKNWRSLSLNQKIEAGIAFINQFPVHNQEKAKIELLPSFLLSPALIVTNEKLDKRYQELLEVYVDDDDLEAFLGPKK